MPTPEDGIRKNFEDYTAACNTGSVSDYKATLTSDVVFFPPDQPAVRGRENVGQWAKEGFFEPFKVTFTPTLERIVVVGSEAFVPGAFTLHLVPKAGGEPIEMSGVFFDILRTDDGGTWKLAHATFNFDQPFPG